MADVLTAEEVLNGRHEGSAAHLLRQWAAVLDIPSGRFVNEDLLSAADAIEAAEAALATERERVERLEKALERLDRAIVDVRHDINADVLESINKLKRVALDLALVEARRARCALEGKP